MAKSRIKTRKKYTVFASSTFKYLEEKSKLVMKNFKKCIKRNRVSWISVLAMVISIIAIGISIIALCKCCPRNGNLSFDYMGVIVGILSLLVTVLIGWQIFYALKIQNDFKGFKEK